MTAPTVRDWTTAVALGAVSLLTGSGVMSVISRFGSFGGLPDWYDFSATTVGDTVLIPILVATLFLSWRLLTLTAGTAALRTLAVGAATGMLGGAGVQLSWLLDRNPRLTWVLPEVHKFSWQGWYHAAFLVLVSGYVFGLVLAVLRQLMVVRRAGAHVPLAAVGSSPLLIAATSCVWLFSFLIVHDGGRGSSLSVTVFAVAAPVAVSSVVLVGLLGTGALRGIVAAALLTAAGALLTVTFRWDLPHVLGVVIALGVAAGVALRDNSWRARGVEYVLVASAVAAVTSYAMATSSLAISLLACVGGVFVAILTATRLAATWGPSATTFDWGATSAVAALASTLPVSVWLSAQPEPSQVYGNVITLVYSVCMMPLLLPPLIKRDTDALLAMEKASGTVTTDAALSETAARVALRSVAWGVAAVAGLLAVVIAAGPSMEFEDGRAEPWLSAGVVITVASIAFASAVLAVCFRKQSWAPTVPCVASVVICVVAVDQITSHYGGRSLRLTFPALLLVLAWEVESIVANAAMRPSWAVRRNWRVPLGLGVGSATAATLAMAVVGGTYDGAGEPAPLLHSFVLLCGVLVANLLLTVSAAWALDWRGSLAPPAMPPAAPNWARYRLRSSLLQDYGLLQLLVIFGTWLPLSALSRGDLATPAGKASGVILACTGMLFFAPVFFLSLRNSVRHVNEQSDKAGRPRGVKLFESLPRVSRTEESQTLRRMFVAREGPVSQQDWAAGLAVHQLHLNLLAMCMALASLVGVAPFLNSVRNDG